MKKFIAMSLATLSLSAFAATEDTLLLRGNVGLNMHIQVDETAAATSLDLTEAAVSVEVASLLSRTNKHLGYKLLARSAKLGKLVNVNDSASEVPYTLAYGDTTSTVNVPLNATDTEFADYSAKGETTKKLYVSYSQPAADLSEGNHEDTITFTIQSN